MKILHIDSSILGANSVSRQISARVVARLRKAHSKSTILYRDLAEDPVSHLSLAYLTASQVPTSPHEPILLADLSMGQAILQEFVEADIIVLGVAFYNYGVPSQLKAWIDRVIVVGKTFRYTDDGALEGLAGSKRVILCVARGGFFAEGSAGAHLEHCETFLKAILGLVGITEFDVVAAEGVSVGPEHRTLALKLSNEAVDKLPT